MADRIVDYGLLVKWNGLNFCVETEGRCGMVDHLVMCLESVCSRRKVDKSAALRSDCPLQSFFGWNFEQDG